MAEKKPAEQKLVEVTLAKSHTHAGNKCKTSDKIKVTELERDWLVKNGVVAKG